MYTTQDFTRLIGTEGFSESLLRDHFTLYEGYVKQTNALIEKMKGLEAGTPEYAELHRRFGWEWNGMRLHELYFGNMAKGGGKHDPESPLCARLKAKWGTCEAWLADFKALGSMRGIGWAILAKDNGSGDLFNVWVNEHDVGHLVGATPILVMDVFEHSYIRDYGIKRADYITAFLKAVDWTVVEGRYN